MQPEVSFGPERQSSYEEWRDQIMAQVEKLGKKHSMALKA
jgi:hypothetical protein